jgi:acetyl-CoA carboxylase carboxyltransferase component
MSPQPVPLPQTVDERLAFAAHHRGVATLGPEQAAALLLRLAELEAMAQRAREVRDDVHESDDAMRTAQYILEGD